MKGFNFEKNLQHQTQAVESTVAVFENLDIKKANIEYDKKVRWYLKFSIKFNKIKQN